MGRETVGGEGCILGSPHYSADANSDLCEPVRCGGVCDGTPCDRASWGDRAVDARNAALDTHLSMAAPTKGIRTKAGILQGMFFLILNVTRILNSYLIVSNLRIVFTR